MIRSLFCCALIAAFVIDNPHCGRYEINRSQLAAMYLESGNYDRALREGQRALREDGESAQRRLLVALAHMGRGEHGQGLEVLIDAIERAPDSEELYSALRSLCREGALYERAGIALRALRAEMPPNAELLATLAWIESRLDHSERAAALLDSAIEVDSDHLFTRIERSQLAIESGDFLRAESELQAALRLEPNEPRLLLTLGEVQLRQDRFSAADSSFRRAMRGEWKANVAAHIAQLYAEEDLPVRAIEYYERAIARDPEDASSLNNLAWTYAEEGILLEHATNLSLRSLQIDGENPIYLDTYAELLYLQGRHVRAFAVIRRALELEEQDSEHWTYVRAQYDKMQSALSPRARL